MQRIVGGTSRVKAVQELVASAIGRSHRPDPVLPRTGGPAGNARLTAWLGLVLLVLFFVEGVTLLSLRELITLHIGIGVVLIPIVLAKTVTTGWRMARYYAGDESYVAAGPPPLLLRLLGPLVVLTGIAVLGSGLALIPLGQDGAQSALVTVAGQRITPVTIHQLSFAAWFVVMTVHTLTRTVPALRVAAGRVSARRVPGARMRAATLVTVVVLGGVAGAAVTAAAGSWVSGGWSSLDHGHDD